MLSFNAFENMDPENFSSAKFYIDDELIAEGRTNYTAGKQDAEFWPNSDISSLKDEYHSGSIVMEEDGRSIKLEVEGVRRCSAHLSTPHWHFDCMAIT
jgi:hypothetical protein